MMLCDWVLRSNPVHRLATSGHRLVRRSGVLPYDRDCSFRKDSFSYQQNSYSANTILTGVSSFYGGAERKVKLPQIEGSSLKNGRWIHVEVLITIFWISETTLHW